MSPGVWQPRAGEQDSACSIWVYHVGEGGVRIFIGMLPLDPLAKSGQPSLCLFQGQRRILVCLGGLGVRHSCSCTSRETLQYKHHDFAGQMLARKVRKSMQPENRYETCTLTQFTSRSTTREFNFETNEGTQLGSSLQHCSAFQGQV